jgi:hypothetical protein
MQRDGSVDESVKLPMEKIIDLVREARNSLVKTFLADHYLKKYFLETYNKQLSAVKVEFIKRELNELLISPVDLTHYSPLIKEIKEKNDASIVTRQEALYIEQINEILKKYNY